MWDAKGDHMLSLRCDLLKIERGEAGLIGTSTIILSITSGTSNSKASPKKPDPKSDIVLMFKSLIKEVIPMLNSEVVHLQSKGLTRKRKQKIYRIESR